MLLKAEQGKDCIRAFQTELVSGFAGLETRGQRPRWQCVGFSVSGRG